LPALSTATPLGLLNRALLPVPFALPGLPARPASVVTAPDGVTFRMVVSSDTYTLPTLSTANLYGKLNRAELFVPFALPVLPASPANVVTTPAGVTFRITWLNVSAK